MCNWGILVTHFTSAVPPYGKDTVNSLQSVFEIKHLRSRALFLNTQCKSVDHLFGNILKRDHLDRMPMPLGNFISEEMYNKKLHSDHKIATFDCVAFVDVTKGHEVKSGTSWTVRKNTDVIPVPR